MTARFGKRRGRESGGSQSPSPDAPQTPDAVPVAPPPVAEQDDAADVAFDLTKAQGDIPPHVWALLQQAGETAAQRLVEILTGPKFIHFTPQAQRALIELALTRAYGLPVRKAVNVTLSTTDADAVARSLLDLSDSLPETARRSLRDVTPSDGAN